MYEIGQYIVYGVRGVCEVMDITTEKVPGSSEDRQYYVLRPYFQQSSKIVTPVDSNKTITRPLLSKEEALKLIGEIRDLPGMQILNDKKREESYREALKTCDCRVWVSMIKTLYLRRKDRLEHGKKMTDLDERYFRSAEENLYSELSLALKMPREEVGEFIENSMNA